MRYLLQVLLFIFLGVALSLLFYLNYHNKYYKQTTFTKEVMDFLVMDTTEYYDMLFVGNSRSMNHFNPIVIDDVTGFKSYNIGIHGTDLPYHFMAIKKYIQCHPKPKVFVLSVDFTTLDIHAPSYNFLEFYQFKHDTVIFNTLSKYIYRYQIPFSFEYFTLQKLLTEPDNNKLHSIKHVFLKENRKTESKFKPVLLRGYDSIAAKIDMPLEENHSYEEVVSEESYQLLEELISFCRKNNVDVVFVSTPVFSAYKKVVRNYKEINDNIRELCNKSSVKFMDYTNDTMCSNESYFYGYLHLNAKGSVVFSNKFAADLLSLKDTNNIQIIPPP